VRPVFDKTVKNVYSCIC